MSQTEQILDRFIETQGWSDSTVLDLALTYIENQSSPEAWEDYLISLAEVDDDIDPASPYGLVGMQRERYDALMEQVGDHDAALRDARQWPAEES
jgi:hypothetical protein